MLTRQQPCSRGISLVAQFVCDLERVQDRSSQPLKAEAIGRVMNEWRDYSRSDVYFREIPAAEHAKRRQAYQATMSDREAGELADTTEVVFRRWRRWVGLPSKGTPGVKAVKGVVVYDNRL